MKEEIRLDRREFLGLFDWTTIFAAGLRTGTEPSFGNHLLATSVIIYKPRNSLYFPLCSCPIFF